MATDNGVAEIDRAGAQAHLGAAEQVFDLQLIAVT
jgi:hypothetical protein